jgi:hypothetical protein
MENVLILKQHLPPLILNKKIIIRNNVADATDGLMEIPYIESRSDLKYYQLI